MFTRFGILLAMLLIGGAANATSLNLPFKGGHKVVHVRPASIRAVERPHRLPQQRASRCTDPFCWIFGPRAER
jgi:hypothetical protein